MGAQRLKHCLGLPTGSWLLEHKGRRMVTCPLLRRQQGRRQHPAKRRKQVYPNRG